MNVLGKHWLVFVLLFFLVILLLTLYDVIRPESPNFNFNPFPTVSPKYLPDNKNSGGDCLHRLTPCDATGGCSSCTSDFVCTDTSALQTPIRLNGIAVPKGLYCLPQNTTQSTCNPVTGQWVWTDSAVGQGWKCECRYPDLYTGKDCSTQVACVSSVTPTLKNKLVASPFNKKWYNKDKPAVWDPLASDETGILQENPLGTDDQNNPLFVCQCDTDQGSGIPLIQLPNDPYSCHVDSCLKVISPQDPYKGNASILDPVTHQCHCENLDGIIPGKPGPNSNTCINPALACRLHSANATRDANSQGRYDPVQDQCTCTTNGGTPFATSRRCRTANDTTPANQNLQPCLEGDHNQLGAECYLECDDPNFRHPDGQPACGFCNHIDNNSACQFSLSPKTPNTSYDCNALLAKYPAPPSSDDETRQNFCCPSPVGGTGIMKRDATHSLYEMEMAGPNCSIEMWPPKAKLVSAFGVNPDTPSFTDPYTLAEGFSWDRMGTWTGKVDYGTNGNNNEISGQTICNGKINSFLPNNDAWGGFDYDRMYCWGCGGYVQFGVCGNPDWHNRYDKTAFSKEVNHTDECKINC